MTTAIPNAFHKVDCRQDNNHISFSIKKMHMNLIQKLCQFHWVTW